MEVKSKEQKTFTYTLTLNSSEVDELLSEASNYDWYGNKKMGSLFAKLSEARSVDLMP